MTDKNRRGPPGKAGPSLTDKDAGAARLVPLMQSALKDGLYTATDRARWLEEIRQIRANRPANLPTLSVQRQAELVASRLGYGRNGIASIRKFLVELDGSTTGDV